MAKRAAADPEKTGSNRIPVADLLKMSAGYNPRKIGEREFEALRASLRTFGTVEPAVVNRRTDTLVGGHQRLRAAKAEGIEDFPVVWVDLDEADERRLNLALNRIGGTWDDEKLRELVDGLMADNIDMLPTGFEDRELAKLIETVGDGGAARDPLVKRDDVEERAELGQLWRLGRHRLLVGDSTERDAVDRLMDGRKADFVFTDPPYGVNVTGKGGDAIAGDISFTAIPLFFDMLDQVLAEKCWVYICGGQSNMLLYAKMFERYFRELPRMIIWDKGSVAVMRANGYHSCFEVVYYSFRQGSGAWWFSGRKSDEADDIWRRTVESGQDRYHPTQKPVDIPLRAIRNTCPPDGVIWEPFGGSGSTLLAAEQAGRACYAMEIDPRFADVILARWEALTGEKAELIDAE